MTAIQTNSWIMMMKQAWAAETVINPRSPQTQGIIMLSLKKITLIFLHKQGCTECQSRTKTTTGLLGQLNGLTRLSQFTHNCGAGGIHRCLSKQASWKDNLPFWLRKDVCSVPLPPADHSDTPINQKYAWFAEICLKDSACTFQPAVFCGLAGHKETTQA